MNLNFNGGESRWTGIAEIAERGEKDKHQPWRATLRPENGEQVEGYFLVTDLAAEAAEKDGNPDSRLGTAFSRAIIAELAMRRLKSGFRFVVDHRWVEGYE